jgi:hydroxymethylbilane synthase
MERAAQREQRRMLRVATRRSALAMAQTKLVVDLLQKNGPVDVEIVPITTKGDAQIDRSLVAIGGDGVFVKELMNALLDERADIAVHSAKDLPTALPSDLDAGVVPEREDARDVLVSKDNVYHSIAALPKSAVVGTSSLRRAAQVHIERSDVSIAPLRGNVDSRVEKVRRGEYDAAILALAGLARLDILASVGGGSPLDFHVMVPAVGQGALFVQCRAADEATRTLIAPLNHERSAFATRLERAFLARIGGGCVAPVGAHVQVEGATWRLWAVVAATDGTRSVRRSAQGSYPGAAEAIAAVEAIASEMLAAGGREIVAESRQRGVETR